MDFRRKIIIGASKLHFTCPEVRFEGTSIEKKLKFFNFFRYFFYNFFFRGVKIAFCLSRGSLWTFWEKPGFRKSLQTVGQKSSDFLQFFSARFSKLVLTSPGERFEESYLFWKENSLYKFFCTLWYQFSVFWQNV